jgi:hypothetical protein
MNTVRHDNTVQDTLFALDKAITKYERDLCALKLARTVLVDPPAPDRATTQGKPGQDDRKPRRPVQPRRLAGCQVREHPRTPRRRRGGVYRAVLLSLFDDGSGTSNEIFARLSEGDPGKYAPHTIQTSASYMKREGLIKQSRFRKGRCFVLSLTDAGEDTALEMAEERTNA